MPDQVTFRAKPPKRMSGDKAYDSAGESNSRKRSR